MRKELINVQLLPWAWLGIHQGCKWALDDDPGLSEHNQCPREQTGRALGARHSGTAHGLCFSLIFGTVKLWGFHFSLSVGMTWKELPCSWWEDSWSLVAWRAAALSRSELPQEISPRWGQRNDLLSFACDFLLIGLPKAAVSSVLWRWVSLGRKLGPALLWQISLLPDGTSTRVVGYGRSFSASLMGGVILNPLQSPAFRSLPHSQNRPSNWLHGLESSLGNWGGAGAGRAPCSAPMLTQPTRAARLHKAAGDPPRNSLRWKISGVSF